MYTSGWPKNQNRFCQSTGTPPPWTVKMWVPKWRSQNSMTTAPNSTGKAMRIRMPVTSMFHEKMGTRNMVIPGARR